MYFTDAQLSVIAMALRQYSYHLSENAPRGAASTAAMELHDLEQRETWALRDVIDAHFKG